MAKVMISLRLPVRSMRARMTAEWKGESTQHVAPPLWRQPLALRTALRRKRAYSSWQPAKVFAPHHYRREGFPLPLSPYTGRALQIEKHRAGMIGTKVKIAPGERHGIVVRTLGDQPLTAAWATGARHARSE
jgi:hypothetical protein